MPCIYRLGYGDIQKKAVEKGMSVCLPKLVNFSWIKAVIYGDQQLLLLFLVQALRMILQLGVKPSWFNTCSTTIDKRPHLIPGTASFKGDLRNYIIDLPPVGDSVVPEMLLKVLDPYRREGRSWVACPTRAIHKKSTI
jgi:hypothetical protein